MPVPWLRILAVAQVALLLKRHLDLLEPDERVELRRIVAKSRGRPGANLSAGERAELRRLVAKLEPGAFGRAAVSHAVRGRKPRP